MAPISFGTKSGQGDPSEVVRRAATEPAPAIWEPIGKMLIHEQVVGLVRCWSMRRIANRSKLKTTTAFYALSKIIGGKLADENARLRETEAAPALRWPPV